MSGKDHNSFKWIASMGWHVVYKESMGLRKVSRWPERALSLKEIVFENLCIDKFPIQHHVKPNRGQGARKPD